MIDTLDVKTFLHAGLRELKGIYFIRKVFKSIGNRAFLTQLQTL